MKALPHPRCSLPRTSTASFPWMWGEISGSARPQAVIPLDAFHAQTCMQTGAAAGLRFALTPPSKVMRGCGNRRDGTWISGNRPGYAPRSWGWPRSSWRAMTDLRGRSKAGGQLAGALRRGHPRGFPANDVLTSADASKVALVAAGRAVAVAVSRCDMFSPHLQRFGAVEIPPNSTSNAWKRPWRSRPALSTRAGAWQDRHHQSARWFTSNHVEHGRAVRRIAACLHRRVRDDGSVVPGSSFCLLRAGSDRPLTFTAVWTRSRSSPPGRGQWRSATRSATSSAASGSAIT
jgi:hypothetical protein